MRAFLMRRKRLADGRDSSCGDRFRLAAHHTTSIADEIASAHWVAQIRPAASAPVIDETGVPHERFESLGFAYRSGGWAPNREYRRKNSLLGGLLRIFKHAFRRADIRVNETQIGNQCGE